MRKCGVVVTMVMVAWVLCGSKFRDGENVVRYNHLLGETCTKFLDLATNIAEEGITGPTSNQQTGTPVRYMALAALDQIEWVVTSSTSKPNTSLPPART